jgi:hypothetical protein
MAATLRGVSDSSTLDLALRLWPEARDRGRVDDPNALDELLATQGRPGAPGYDCGLRRTFACFAPDVEAGLTLSTGERTTSDAEARFIAHVLVTRTLLAAGLHIDDRVTGAMGATYGLTWTVIAGRHDRSPLALATTLWLVSLDPLSDSDRPLPINWDPACFDDPERWDPEYRLFSHYDVRERAIDWAVYVSADPTRREGCSIWTIVEPLLRLDEDNRVQLALAAYAQAADGPTEGVGAAAMLERGRIAAMLQGHISLNARR